MDETEARELEQLTIAVGVHFADQPQCVAAVGVLEVAARILGYDLAPRPVSILTETTGGGGRPVATGKKAVAAGGEPFSARRDDQWGDDFDVAGHMVATSEDGWFLDPTFTQFASAGVPRNVLVFTTDVHPAAGIVERGDDDFNVKYWFEDDLEDWQGPYTEAQSANLALAREIAEVVQPDLGS